MKRPSHFQDVMITGPFRYFKHDHTFTQQGRDTLMIDCLEFGSPVPVLGLLQIFSSFGITSSNFFTDAILLLKQQRSQINGATTWLPQSEQNNCSRALQNNPALNSQNRKQQNKNLQPTNDSCVNRFKMHPGKQRAHKKEPARFQTIDKVLSGIV